MLLYNSQVSGNCYKVRLLPTQLGIAFERREMDVVELVTALAGAGLLLLRMLWRAIRARSAGSSARSSRSS